MGQKYSSQASAGYNSSPPPDDGSTVAANKITWAGIKSKLADVLKTFVEAVNSTIVTALDYSATTTSVNYTTVAGDHEKLIECTGTITISLGDAATMAAGYRAGAYNKGTGVVTVAVITAANTVNGNANGTIKLLPGQGMWFVVNQAANGYDIDKDSIRNIIILTGAAGTNTVTAACDSVTTGLSAGQLFLLVPAAANTGATTVNITPSGGSALGAKNVFVNGGALVGGEFQNGVPQLLEYDGTQFNVIGAGLNATTTRSANTVLAGPTSGAAAAPTFRTLVGADGGSLVWLGTQTAASSATLDFTSLITSTFDDYLIRLDAVLPATNGANLLFRVSTDNGLSFLATTQYNATRINNRTASTAANGAGDTNTSAVTLFDSLSSTSGKGSWGRIDLHAESGQAVATIQWQLSGYESTIGDITYQNGGGIVAATSVNAIRFVMSSGNITSGTIRLYGIRKS